MVIYLFGGLTFLPLVALAVLAVLYYASPLAQTTPKKTDAKNEDSLVAEELQASEDVKDDDELEGVDAHKVGWLRVTREYDPTIGMTVGPDKIPGNNRGKYMEKMRSLLDRQDKQETLAPNSPGFLKQKGAMFYAVLKHGGFSFLSIMLTFR